MRDETMRDETMRDETMRDETMIKNKKFNKLYYSDIVGTYINNAITGEKYPFTVGSRQEKKLFKVKDNTIDARFNNNYIARTLYYGSPEEYMKFTNCILSEDIINNWKERVNII